MHCTARDFAHTRATQGAPARAANCAKHSAVILEAKPKDFAEGL